MQRYNTKLLNKLKEERLTQGELVRGADLSSETRLSRILNGFTEPTPYEVSKISQFLGVSPKALGFSPLSVNSNELLEESANG